MTNEHPYFGGSSVFDGKVRRLQARNFKELVESYIFAPVLFPLSRRDFHALPEEVQNKRKDGPWISAAGYPFEEGKREDDSATAVTLVILDLDEGQHVRDFFESPESVGEHLYPLNYCMWTTAKSTAKNPRLKIMVDIEVCHPSNHRRMVKYITSRLGIPQDFKGSRESKVLSQPQFRPLQFNGEQFSSVQASRLNGVPLSVADLPEESDDELDEFLNERTFACDRGEDYDSLGLAYLPIADLTVEDIREPLLSISPDCGYKEWIMLVAALRANFIGEEEARQAYELFDEWSSGGTKYKSEKETYGKWRSVRPYAKGRAPITIRSLFHLAQKSGWQNSKVAGKLKASTLDWINACECGDELMSEGSKRIAAMPFANDVVEEALIMAWKKRLSDLTGANIKLETLKRSIVKARKRDRAEKDAAREESIPGWLQPMCFIATENTFYNSATKIRLTPAAFDNKFSIELMPKDGAEIPANGRPIVLPSSYALNLKQIKRVDETIYWPLHAGDDAFFIHPNGRSYLNTYDRYDAPVQDPDNADRALELFYDLLRPMIPADYLELFIDHHAYVVQNPGHKNRWSFLIQSAEGAGKGYFGKIFRQVLGPSNVRIVSPEVLQSQWNDWSGDTLYIVLEEVHIPGELRERVTNSLKPLIADDTITINKRNTTAQCDKPNYATVIAFTNYHNALHLKDIDRRWCVLYSPLQSKKQIQELTATGHFEKLEWLLTQQGAGGLRYALMTRKINDNYPVNGPAPVTKYLTHLVEESKNHLQVEIEDLISDEDQPLVGSDIIFLPALTNRMSGSPKDRNRATHYLSALGYYCESPTRVSINGERGPIWLHTDNYVIGDTSPLEILKIRAELEEFEI